MLSDIIEPITKLSPVCKEAQSTEEIMREIEDCNTRLLLNPSRNIMVGSMDVVALYPSIDQRLGARIVAEEFLKSGIEVQGVDYRAASIYLSVNVHKDELQREGLLHLIPRRVSNLGRKHTIRTPELSGPIPRSERRNPDDVEEAIDPEMLWPASD